ncbi:MAG: hypothetical protein IKV82_04910 [Akkermansia sp.]|nr:hypothetical protein [Akkermansia sp.]
MKNKTLWYSLLIALLAAIVAVAESPLTLRNDDFQIYFLLLNGGVQSDAMGYGIFTNYAMGWILAQLSMLFPNLNVYLLNLFVLSFAACWSANYVALGTTRRAQEEEDKNVYGTVVKLVSVVWLFVLNVVSLRVLQYTQVAMWAAVSGVLFLSTVQNGRFVFLKSLASGALLIGAFVLRESVVLPAIFVAIAVSLGIAWPKRYAIALLVICSLLAGLHLCNNVAYNLHPEWNEAKVCMSVRQKILDSPDNSGLDKSAKIAESGMNPESYSLFKSFVYVPSMDDATKMADALRIHKEGRIGVFGNASLADMGFLQAPVKQRMDLHGGTTIFMWLTPWVPFILMVFLWGLGANRKTIKPAGMMLAVVVAYIVALFLYQRMVGRVLTPVLYGATVWLMTLQPSKNTITKNVCVNIGAAVMSLLCILFYVRHWQFGTRDTGETACEYCAAHPENFYLTTSQQGLGLYPVGFTGYSWQWLQKSNILPISDGWSFYTPAYKAALSARGFSSLRDAFFHPSSFIVIRDCEQAGAMRFLERLAMCEWNKKIEFSIVDKRGEFYFVKVIQK